MRPMLLAALAVVLTGTVAGGQSPSDARTVLDRSREAITSLSTVVYEARAEARSARSSRVERGTVQMTRFAYSHEVGGRLKIHGRAERPKRDPVEFSVVFNGLQAQRMIPGDKRLLQGDVGFGGKGVLWSTGKSLVMRVLLEERPFAKELKKTTLTLAGREVVEGVDCDVVEVSYDDGASAQWFIGVEDRLPRRHLRRYKSTRGSDVTSDQVLSGLVVNTTLDDTLFEFEVPEDYTLEIVGRRPPPPIGVGDLVPDFTLPDGDGNLYSLKDYRGQVVLLEFWSTWCHYCQESMPSLQRLHDEWSGNGAAVLAINCRDTANADASKFVRDAGFDYPVLIEASTVAARYRVTGIPHLYLVGPDGRLIYQQVGFGETAEARVETMIRENVR